MALFKSNPEKAIQREIDAAHANRERVSARLADCDQAIARHAAAAKDCALTGDDAGLEAAEASLRSAQDRAVSFRTALSDIDQQLANLERNKAETADRKVRAETAAEIERLASSNGARIQNPPRMRCSTLAASPAAGEGWPGGCRPGALHGLSAAARRDACPSPVRRGDDAMT
jgi:hypothetical protein